MTNLYELSYGSIYQCTSCKSEFLNPYQDVHYDEAYYHSWFHNQDQHVETMKRANFREFLTSHFGTLKNKRLLDIGCATGFLLQEAQSLGATVYGVDISEWSVEQAKKSMPDTRIYCGQLDQALEEKYFNEDFFDIIIGTDVVEHVNDVKTFLEVVVNIMKVDGMAAFTTPDLASLSRRLLGSNWFQYKNEHRCFISRKALALLSAKIGFTIESIVPVRKILTPGFIFNVLRCNNTGFSHRIGCLGEILAKWLFLSKSRFSFRTGEMLFLISKK